MRIISFLWELRHSLCFLWCSVILDEFRADLRNSPLSGRAVYRIRDRRRSS
jgi:hypothetical protein